MKIKFNLTLDINEHNYNNKKRYTIEPIELIYDKGYVFLSFAKNMGKIISQNISTNLRAKYGQRILDHSKKPATNAFNTTSKK